MSAITSWTRTLVPCPRCGPGAGVVKQQGGNLFCFRCKQNVKKEPYAIRRAAISEEAIEQAHRALLTNAERLSYLTDARGLSLDTIRAHRLGLISGEIQVPYPDGEGGWTLGKKHSRDRHGKHRLMYAGKGEAGLYGLPVNAAFPVLLCEGEWDCLAARSRGFNAYSTGAGADTFKAEWAQLFKNAPSIYIVYDVDEAGTNGTATVIAALKGAGIHQGRIHPVRLPLSGKKGEKDLTDYFLAGHTAKQLEKLLAEARAVGDLDTPKEDETVYPASLAEAGSETYAGKWCSFKATVVGTTEDPWLVPTKLRVDCNKDSECCKSCKVWPSPKPESFPFNVHDVSYIDLVATPLTQQIPKIRNLLGIPAKCRSVSLTPEASQNIWELRLSEQFRLDSSRDQRLYHALSLGLDLRTNETYEVEARTVADPRNQLRVQVIRKAIPSDSDLAAYQHPRGVLRPMMRRKGAAIAKHVATLLEDASRISGNIGRPDLHQLYLMAYCSPRWIQWDEHRQIRGTLDVLVLGDSSEGKTTTAKALMEWIGLGDLVSLKRITEKALIGGQATEGGKSWINPGYDPRADERLIFYDEVKGATTATLATLTSARSEGFAEIGTVKHRQKLPTRVRRVWISNLRGGTGEAEVSMASLAYPCIGIVKLFGALEDVRRLDAALGLLAGEVDTTRGAQRSEPKILSRKVLHHLVMKAWTLPPVVLTPAIRETCQKRASEMMAVYSTDNLPLVATDHRDKLARLGCAVAGMLGEDPAPEHVDFAADWLDRIYTSRALGYREWSELTKASRTVRDPDVTRTALYEALGPARGSFTALCAQLLSRPSFTSGQFKELFSDRIAADICLSTLVLQNALRDNGRGWVKTDGFAELLRGWSQEKKP